MSASLYLVFSSACAMVASVTLRRALISDATRLPSL